MNEVDLQRYIARPFGSLILQPEETHDETINNWAKLPEKMRSVTSSARTAAFLIGLSKNYGIETNKLGIVSWAVFLVSLGDLKLSQLAATLSSEVPMPNDKAQAMAVEIERELFAPLALELAEVRKNRSVADAEGRAGQAQAAGAQNVVNLRKVQ